MSIISQLTFVHMEAATATDKIGRLLSRWNHHANDREKIDGIVDEIAMEAVRLRRQLESFFEQERRELLPRVQRIFGADCKEARALQHTEGMVLTALDRFIIVLTDDLEAPDDPRVRLARLRKLFTEFTTCLQQRRDADQRFYAHYSTMLYPGGLSTE